MKAARFLPVLLKPFRHIAAAAIGISVVLVFLAPLFMLTPATSDTLKIGIIGTGRIGGALAEHWAKAGHELVISSRNPEMLQELARSLGPQVRVGTPREAAAFGEVVVISVPYAALPQIGQDYAQELAGKVVLDTGNPYPARDGAMAEAARRKGTGVASAEYLPGVRLVRAFNSIPAERLRNGANQTPAKIAVPLAADDSEALAMAQRLVEDAGFDYVVVGDLARAQVFDVDKPGYGQALTAAELRRVFGM